MSAVLAAAPCASAAVPATRVLRGAVAPRYTFAALADVLLHPAAGHASVTSGFEELSAYDAAFDAGRAAGLAEARDAAAATDARRAASDAETAEAAERLASDHADQLAASDAALRDALARAEAAEAHASGTAERLSVLWTESVGALQPALAALAIAAAEGVLSAPLSEAQRAASDRAISDAVDAVASGGPSCLRLHPVDLLHLQEHGLAEALTATHAGLRLDGDPTLAPGDWTVEAPEAEVHRLRGPMLDTLRERLGLPRLLDIS